AATITSSPPIVGVPDFTEWCSGPSFRMCWPYSRRRRNSMNRGPSRIEMTRATTPATRTRATLRGDHCQGFGKRLEADGARALHEDTVAGADQGARSLCRLRRVRRPIGGAVLARELADGEHGDSEPARQARDL